MIQNLSIDTLVPRFLETSFSWREKMYTCIEKKEREGENRSRVFSPDILYYPYRIENVSSSPFSEEERDCDRSIPRNEQSDD